MSPTINNESSTAVETPVATKTKAKAKKAPAKKEATVKSKKAAPAKAKKAASGDRPKPDYLRNPQIEILRVLKKKGLSRAQILEKLTKAVSLSEMLGSPNGEPNRYTKTLCEWKYVKMETHDIDGRDTDVFSLTAAGKAALEKIEKEEARK